MPSTLTFAYRARDGAGQIVTGTLAALSAAEVSQRLRAEGKFAVSISENVQRASKPEVPSATSEQEGEVEQIKHSELARQVRREDVISFCQQLSVMLETGVPLSEAMEAFIKQTPRKGIREIISALRDDICAGDPISVAMERWPRVFPVTMTSLMKASEASGTMAMMLGRIAGYLTKEQRTARQIKGALGYPMFMMAIAVLLTVFLMTFVLPRFAAIYEMRSAALPRPTQMLLSVSEFFTTQYMYYIPALAATAVGLAFWLRSEFGRVCCDWLRLHTPVIGRMYRQLYITRSARTMGTLLSAGVNLLDIIEICRGITNNRHYDRLWTQAAEAIREGKQFSEAISESPLIPANIASMIASGERSGRLAEVMERIAEHSEEELDNAVKQTTSYIEPAMILIMGVLVGGVTMALLLPIFRMGAMMSGG